MAECLNCGDEFLADSPDSTACALCAMMPDNILGTYDPSFHHIRSSYEVGAQKVTGTGNTGKCMYRARPNNYQYYKRRECSDCKQIFFPESPYKRCPACAEKYRAAKPYRIKLYLPATEDIPAGTHVIKPTTDIIFQEELQKGATIVYRGSTQKRPYTVFKTFKGFLIHATVPDVYFSTY